MYQKCLLLAFLMLFAGISEGTAIYYLDFDHGVQSPAPTPYIASGSEVMPAGASMDLFDPTAMPLLVTSSIGNAQGGEALKIVNAGDPYQGGYSITNNPEITTSRTIEFLIRPNFSYNEPDLYVLLESNGHDFDQTLYIRGNVSSDKHKLEWYPSYQVAGVSKLTSSTVLQQDRWYHVALVMDQGSQFVGLYIDGVLEASCTIPNTWVALYPIHSNFSIGCALSVNRRNFRGEIDAFAISDFAMEPGEFLLTIPDNVVYMLNFDHGAQLPAPTPYLAGAGEKIPAGASVTLFDTGAQAELVDSGSMAKQGGESLWIKNAGDPWQGGYDINSSPEITVSRTLEFLIRPSFTYNEPDMYVLLESVGHDFDQTFYITGGNQATPHVLQWYPTYQAGGVRKLSSTTVLEHGNWYHVALSADFSNEFVGLYVNGIREDSCPMPNTWGSLYPIHSDFSLGCALGQTRRNYTGLIDAFALTAIPIVGDANDSTGFVLPMERCAFYDLTDDCRVDGEDLAVLASQWLDCTMPGDPDCEGSVSEYMIAQGMAVVDGDLSEWADARWIALDQEYYQTADDITEAKYALRWDPINDKIYAAVVVEDTVMTFTDTPGEWDGSDRLEIYSQGDAAGGVGYGAGYSELFDIAQQYLVGSASNMVDSWAAFANNDPNVGSGYADFEHAVVVDQSNGIIYYEVGVKQYDNYGGISGGATVITDLEAGDTVAFDIAVDTRYGSEPWDFGILSENTMQDKFYSASSFQLYELEGSECGYWGYPGADLTGAGGSPDCYVSFFDFAAIASEWLLGGM